MAQGGIIARVRPGLYLVPPRLPLGGAWGPGEGLALNTLMQARGGRCQICGQNAFNRYGFSNQLPARIYAYNNRICGRRTIAAVEFRLIKVADERLGETEESRDYYGNVALYSSRVRTLVDAVYDWSRFNTLPRAYRWIRDDLAEEKTMPAELVRVTLRYGDVGTVRRVGALLERLGIEARLLRKLERRLRRSSAFIPWDPTRPKRGSIDRRWGVVCNDPRWGIRRFDDR